MNDWIAAIVLCMVASTNVEDRRAEAWQPELTFNQMQEMAITRIPIRFSPPDPTSPLAIALGVNDIK